MITATLNIDIQNNWLLEKETLRFMSVENSKVPRPLLLSVRQAYKRSPIALFDRLIYFF